MSSPCTTKPVPVGKQLAAWTMLAAAASLAGCAGTAKVTGLALEGSRELRHRANDAPLNSPDKPPLLILALDGIDRALLYDMLKNGELPALAGLLGGAEGNFAHAHLDETLLATMPSSTLAAWSTVMSGLPPAVHGIAGNEFYVRETHHFAAPAPVSFSDTLPVAEIFADNYLAEFNGEPTVYNRMRATDPNIEIWVAMHQIFFGADELILTKPAILLKAFEQVIEDAAAAITKSTAARCIYEKIDSEGLEAVLSKLKHGPLPDVLTIYFGGTDLYAHVAKEGPDEARRGYLKEVTDPLLAKLTKALQDRDALKNRYVIVTSDHGHTEVRYDDVHALGVEKEDSPRAVVTKAGFRLRPPKLTVSDKEPYNAVLAYGGAVAFAYVADRSSCPGDKDVCDWKLPPRYEEDVLPLADAFYKTNLDGVSAPGMKGVLDMVLTRKPKPYAEVDLPFEVYIGNGKTQPLHEYLAAHPHPTYVAFEERMRDLAVGPRGERAGDVMLIAHNGDEPTPDLRFYFAARYHSWHGSPGRKDSEVPLIVAHPQRTAASLKAQIDRILGPEPRRQQKVTDILLELRSGKE